MMDLEQFWLHLDSVGMHVLLLIVCVWMTLSYHHTKFELNISEINYAVAIYLLAKVR